MSAGFLEIYGDWKQKLVKIEQRLKLAKPFIESNQTRKNKTEKTDRLDFPIFIDVNKIINIFLARFYYLFKFSNNYKKFKII